MKTHNIKKVVLGPKQLTFGFDNRFQQEQDFIVSFITKQIEAHGYLELNKLVSEVSEVHDFPESDTLQYVFWSAEELKIHFRVDGKSVTPFQTKKILLESPTESVELITNKIVHHSIFTDVTSFYQKLSKKKNPKHFDDQYIFSRSLITDLQNWESRLKTYKPFAEKPFYPGRKRIDEHLGSLKIILAKLDAYSLIYACHKNKDKILNMADDVKIISTFYTRHIKFWDMLIQSIESFQVNLNEIKKNPEISAGFDRLIQIISSASPYNLIAEAEILLKKVQNHNDLIVQKKTAEYQKKASSQIDSMIEMLVRLLDNSNPDPDRRNRFLYPLRRAKKQLPQTKSINRINQILYDTEDRFDDYIEELKKEL